MVPFRQFVLLGCILAAAGDAGAEAPPTGVSLKLICRRDLATERFAALLRDDPFADPIVSVEVCESGAALREALQGSAAAPLGAPDLVVFDRIELAEFVSRGRLLRLNEMTARSDLFARLLPQWRAAYSEYPADSGDLYALPLNPDCRVLVINRSLWDDAAERAAFQEQHGAPLQVPTNFRELVRAAQFFHRPSKGRFGLGWAAGGDERATAALFVRVVRSMGGEPWSASAGRASEYLNSTTGRAALALCRQLAACAPPGTIAWSEADVLLALSEGRVAMAIVRRSTLCRTPHETSALTVSDLPRLGEVEAGPGSAGELGGLCIGIARRSPNAAAAWRFIRAWMEETRQQQWMDSGMVSPLAALLRNATDPARPSGLDVLLRCTGAPARDDSHPASASIMDAMQSGLREAIFGGGDGNAMLDQCAAQADELLAGEGVCDHVLVEIRLRAKRGGEAMLRERLRDWLMEQPLADGYLGFELRQSRADGRDVVVWQRWRGNAVVPTAAALAGSRSWTGMIDECLSESPVVTAWRVLDSSAGADQKFAQRVRRSPAIRE